MGRRMWRTKGNAQYEVLIWGVPGRLDTELTLLALSFCSLPLPGPLFLCFSISQMALPSLRNTKLQLNVRAGIFPSLYGTLACSCDFPSTQNPKHGEA